MKHIVLPVAVEDFVQGEARAVERELLEPGDVYPAGEVLAGLQESRTVSVC